jgi:phospholipid transport system substrate-binding protein
MNTKTLFLSCIFVFNTFFIQAAALAAGPMEQIEGSVNDVLKILGNDKLDPERKKESIGTIIRQRFHFRAMAQQTLAQNWRKASAEEQEDFVELFSRLVLATYMSRIESYTDERVGFVKEKVDGDRAVVDSVIVTANLEIPVTYKLVKSGSEWLVYDVLVEEVSLVRNFRSSYQDIVKKEGFTGLLAKMQEKIKSLETPKETG